MVALARSDAHLSLAEKLAAAPKAVRNEFYENLTEEKAKLLRYEWRNWWARPNQLMPPLEHPWDVWLIMAGRGFGKALALDTPLPTPTGWTTMGEVRVGDCLLDECGTPCRVTYTTPVQLDRVCYRLTFSDGTTVVADADHQWETVDKRARKALGRAKNPTHGPRVVTTQQIVETLHHKSGEVNHAIPTAGALNLPAQPLPIEPYTLGAWLGDGTSCHAEITTPDAEVIEAIAADGYGVRQYNTADDKADRYGIGGAASNRDPDTGRFLPNPESLHRQLIELGVMENKHIPAMYLRGSFQQRLALLQGLMDTDGYISPGGNCEFCTVTKALATGVYELCMTLGLKATVITGRATLEGRDCGLKYRVCFTPYIPVFRLSRKAQHVKAPGGAQFKRQLRRYIVNAERVESVPVKCIQVDSPSHLFLCSESFIPTHNTRAGAEAVRELVMQHGYGRIALVARTAADARDVMVEGQSGLLSVFPPWFRPKYEPSKRRVTFPNGAIATTYSGDKPDQLRGPQHDAAWCDELAAWRYPESWDQLQFGLRLGVRPLAIVTTTPRPTPLMRELVDESAPEPTLGKPVVLTTGSTYDNALHLAGSALKTLRRKYEGTRLGRQELNAELLTDTPGALWTLDMIEASRIRPVAGEESFEVSTPPLVRIVVSVDPPGGDKDTNPDAAEAGIVVSGMDARGHGYVLDDLSVGGSPAKWARAALEAYYRYEADVLVAEVNNGGEMVEHTVQSVVKEGEDKPNVKQVRASRGKMTRAEPVSALYEQGRVHHVGAFSELEDQMCTWVPGQKSPDRLDAAVWGLTELLIATGDGDWRNAYAGKRRGLQRRTSYNPGRVRGR